VHLVPVGGQVIQPPAVLVEVAQSDGVGAWTVLACQPSRQIARLPIIE
jgi:hypothetical protein